MKTGFTLIELLVVVLILGILAAIALPSYQVAVRKSRMANLVALATSVAKAEEAYYMANGTYTPDFADLDISVPGTSYGLGNTRFGANLCALLPKDSSVDYVYCGWSCRQKEEDPRCGNLYVVYFTFSRHPNVHECHAYDDIGDRTCLSSGGTLYRDTGYSRIYHFD